MLCLFWDALYIELKLYWTHKIELSTTALLCKFTKLYDFIFDLGVTSAHFACQRPFKTNWVCGLIVLQPTGIRHHRRHSS